MVIRFKWYVSEAFNDGVLRPCSFAAEASEGFKDAISDLLMDDGGGGHVSSIPSIKVVLQKICQVKAGDIEFYDWAREAWGAEISKSQVKIYSQYDDSYFEILDLVDFKNALSAWLEFIGSTPALDGVMDISMGLNLE